MSKEAKTKDAKAKHPKQLFRSEKDRMIAGVAGGLADYFDIDSTIVRLIFIVSLFFGGTGFLIYIILWIIVPTESSVHRPGSGEAAKEGAKELEEKATNFAKEAEQFAERRDARIWVGIAMLLLGLWLLLANFHIVNFFFIGKLWPLLLVVLGLSVLLRRGER